MTRIKLCGMMREKDIHVANALMPEYIGFVFAKGSRRYVNADTAAEWKKLLLPEILCVGVFVNEKPEWIEKLVRQKTIDIVQLHGTEDEEYVAQLKKKVPCQIIRAFSLKNREDIRKANESCADLILLDGEKGGGGEPFDWSLLREIERPYFLAGGLTAESAVRAVRELRPFALDVSSGIETDGKKDPGKMREFVTAVQRAERIDKNR